MAPPPPRNEKVNRYRIQMQKHSVGKFIWLNCNHYLKERNVTFQERNIQEQKKINILKENTFMVNT